MINFSETYNCDEVYILVYLIFSQMVMWQLIITATVQHLFFSLHAKNLDLNAQAAQLNHLLMECV